jgi:hypothetical protein
MRRWLGGVAVMRVEKRVLRTSGVGGGTSQVGDGARTYENIEDNNIFI